MVHNGGSSNFKELLFDKKTNYLVQIWQSLSYKVCSIIPLKFNTFGLFIPILGISTIIDQTACCYNVMTSETALYNMLVHTWNIKLLIILTCSRKFLIPKQGSVTFPIDILNPGKSIIPKLNMFVEKMKFEIG